MKVLLIAHACHSRTEGQQRAQILGQLSDIELMVVYPDRWYEYGKWRTIDKPENPSYKYRCEHVRWPWTGKCQWYLHHYPSLPEIMREFQPDIIDLWEEAWGLVSVQTCWLRNKLVPHAKILSETEANINRTHPIPFKWFRTYTLRNTDYAIARQTEGIDVLRAKGYSGAVDVVGNGVDVGIFRPLNREECKASLGLSGFVAGYVGRLEESKGLMEILDAAYASRDVNFVFVGDGSLKQDLVSRIAELGLQDRVKLLPPKDRQELPTVMNAIDTLLIPSRTTATWKEQFGRVIIEAHACGTPVIGSDSGAIPEIVGKAGIIVPEGDARALAEAIKRLQAEPSVALRLGRIGRQQVQDHYEWQRIAERMRAIYLKMHNAPEYEKAAPSPVPSELFGASKA